MDKRKRNFVIALGIVVFVTFFIFGFFSYLNETCLVNRELPYCYFESKECLEYGPEEEVECNYTSETWLRHNITKEGIILNEPINIPCMSDKEKDDLLEVLLKNAKYDENYIPWG